MKVHQLALSTLLLGNFSHAAVLFTEDFGYVDGNLSGNGPWGVHSGTDNPIQVTSGAAVLNQGSGLRIDVSIPFTPVSEGTVTASFDLSVSDDAPIVGTDFEYFAHFFTPGAGSFRSRVDIQSPTVGGDYTLGIASNNATAEATLSIDFSFDSIVPVIITFDTSTGTSSLSAGGQTIEGTATGALPVNKFALRQSNSTSDETITIDNLVISDDNGVPEPSTILLGGLALLGLVRRKR